jgi:aspartate/methionine/tyrosine aminotransferase
VPLPLRESFEFAFDLDELRARVSPKTRMVILNTPQNPTGGLLGPAELDAVAELALRHDFWVLSDEVYARMTYEAPFQSILSRPGMAERSIIIDGFSKTFAMTGWRLGYAIVPPVLAAALARLETNLHSCTATFVQHAGIAALRGPQEAPRAMVAEFKRRRDRIVAGLNALPGFSCLSPKGAFYVFPNVTQACRDLGFADARALQGYLLDEAGVAVLARSFFGERNDGETDEFIRLSYATSMERIDAGLERMAAALARRAEGSCLSRP